MSAAGIEEESAGLLESHSIGTSKPPANPAAAELFHDFCGRPETTQVGVTVENRFFRGFQHAEIDWNKPVHGLLVDFKGDSMQIGMILQRLEVGTRISTCPVGNCIFFWNLCVWFSQGLHAFFGMSFVDATWHAMKHQGPRSLDLLSRPGLWRAVCIPWEPSTLQWWLLASGFKICVFRKTLEVDRNRMMMNTNEPMSHGKKTTTRLALYSSGRL